jgi:hypothetical protein
MDRPTLGNIERLHCDICGKLADKIVRCTKCEYIMCTTCFSSKGEICQSCRWIRKYASKLDMVV